MVWRLCDIWWATQAAEAQGNPPEIRASRDATLARSDGKLYVPGVTFSTQDDYKLLKQ